MSQVDTTLRRLHECGVTHVNLRPSSQGGWFAIIILDNEATERLGYDFDTYEFEGEAGGSVANLLSLALEFVEGEHELVFEVPQNGMLN